MLQWLSRDMLTLPNNHQTAINAPLNQSKHCRLQSKTMRRDQLMNTKCIKSSNSIYALQHKLERILSFEVLCLRCVCVNDKLYEKYVVITTECV